MTERNKKILVVEDERPLIEAISSKLSTNGFEVINARSVDQAIEMLEFEGGVNAVWLDHYLIGKEDGLAFVKKMRENEKWKNIPVFVVSNTASPDKVKTYLEFGAEKYYIKAENRLDEIIADINNKIS